MNNAITGRIGLSRRKALFAKMAMFKAYRGQRGRGIPGVRLQYVGKNENYLFESSVPAKCDFYVDRKSKGQ